LAGAGDRGGGEFFRGERRIRFEHSFAEAGAGVVEFTGRGVEFTFLSAEEPVEAADFVLGGLGFAEGFIMPGFGGGGVRSGAGEVVEPLSEAADLALDAGDVDAGKVEAFELG
jgi:hypothetical protein